MARTKSQPGVEVQILVDGKPVREYKTIQTKNDLAVSIIQVESDEEFAIMARVQSPYEIIHDAVTFKVQINNGQVLRAIFLKEAYETKGMILDKTIPGVYEGIGDGRVLRPFKFEQMPANDGTNIPSNVRSTKGEIIVRVYEAKSADLDSPPISFAMSHGDPKPGKQQVVYKNVNNDPISTYVFKYQNGRPTPINTPTRNKLLHSIPLFDSDSVEDGNVPGPKKREQEFDQDTPSKRPKQKAGNKRYQPTAEDHNSDDDETPPIRAPLFKKAPTPRRTPSKPKRDNRKHQATIEECNDSDGDSPGTLSSSSQPLRSPSKAVTPASKAAPARKLTEGNKATPKKSQPTPTTPAKKTPSKFEGLKLKPKDSPKEKGITETIDLTGDSD